MEKLIENVFDRKELHAKINELKKSIEILHNCIKPSDGIEVEAHEAREGLRQIIGLLKVANEEMHRKRVAGKKEVDAIFRKGLDLEGFSEGRTRVMDIQTRNFQDAYDIREFREVISDIEAFMKPSYTANTSFDVPFWTEQDAFWRIKDFCVENLNALIDVCTQVFRSDNIEGIQKEISSSRKEKLVSLLDCIMDDETFISAIQSISARGLRTAMVDAIANV